MWYEVAVGKPCVLGTCITFIGIERHSQHLEHKCTCGGKAAMPCLWHWRHDISTRGLYHKLQSVLIFYYWDRFRKFLLLLWTEQSMCTRIKVQFSWGEHSWVSQSRSIRWSFYLAADAFCLRSLSQMRVRSSNMWSIGTPNRTHLRVQTLEVCRDRGFHLLWEGKGLWSHLTSFALQGSWMSLVCMLNSRRWLTKCHSRVQSVHKKSACQERPN